MATQSQQGSLDDAPCLKCSDIVNKSSKALQCDLCTGWVHVTCVDISGKENTALQSMKGSVWLCETCQDDFPKMPKKIATLEDENSALRLQLEELSELPKSKALEQELSSIKSSNGWEVQRKRNHSSPFPITHPNHFALLASKNIPSPMAPATPPSPPPRVRAMDNQNKAEAVAPQTSTLRKYSQKANGIDSLFYLRAIPRTTKFEEVKEKLTSFGVSAESLSLPPSLSTQSRRMYMTISLSTEEANKLASALEKTLTSAGSSVYFPIGPQEPIKPTCIENHVKFLAYG